RRQVPVQHITELTLDPLESLFKNLLNGEMLVRRLEVSALKTVGEVPELLHQLRSPADAVLPAPRRAQFDEIPLYGDDLLIELVAGLSQFRVLNQVFQVRDLTAEQFGTIDRVDRVVEIAANGHQHLLLGGDVRVRTGRMGILEHP